MIESRELIESGPLRARLRLRFAAGASRLTMDYVLDRYARAVRVDATVDWRERLHVLKLVFPVVVASPVWTSESAYGETVRPLGGPEAPMQGWTDLSDQAHGLAIANDSKYGVDVRDGALRITIVRSPVYAHQGAFKRRDDEHYQDQGSHDFRLLLFPHGAEWRAELTQLTHLLNSPPAISWEGTHAGRIPVSSRPLVHVTDPGVVVMAIKRAEDDDAWIVRAYAVAEGAREPVFEIPALGRCWTAVFRAGQVQTFLIPDGGGAVRTVDFLEGLDG